MWVDAIVGQCLTNHSTGAKYKRRPEERSVLYTFAVRERAWRFLI